MEWFTRFINWIWFKPPKTEKICNIDTGIVKNDWLAIFCLSITSSVCLLMCCA